MSGASWREEPPDHVDVLIVGAGLSGIGAACRLRMDRPGTSLAILESRQAMGGTWDLFRYPGVRSDSDMFTLGFSFRPWEEPKAIADGPSICGYIGADGPGLRRRGRGAVRVHRRVGVFWSTPGRQVDGALSGATAPDEVVEMTCRFLYMCTGYYRYSAGYTPSFAGVGDFEGTVVHPQHWPEDLDVSGKRVVVIGSGATAVTLVPALTRADAHVTMLQRTPTYIMSLPSRDPLADRLRSLLPARRPTIWSAGRTCW